MLTPQSVAVIVVLLAVAYLFAQIAHHASLPPAAAIVLVGIAAGGMLPGDLHVGLTPAVLALFLPALIFEGAWSIDAAALRRTAWAIAVLAVPGVAFTAALVASASV
ncbi:MAG: cation:proton antiporter, partial [Candidatus Eremiobacteraeota bacterium]|nr:cation:proton antiporter [Candidatus Eremiobacteraeota bacterium]